MTTESILSILAHDAWNGGTQVGNGVYEDKGLSFIKLCIELATGNERIPNDRHQY